MLKICLELKAGKPTWTEKRKKEKSPATNQAGRTDTDEGSCNVNRKHCFCQDQGAVRNYNNDPLFGWLLTSDAPDHVLFSFLTRDTQLLSHLDTFTS